MTVAAKYIRDTSGARWDNTNINCAFWVADFVLSETGVDPAKEYRGKFKRAFEYRAFLIEAGGLLNVSRKAMGAGTDENVDGPCVARARTRVLAGIMSGGRLFIKTDGGVVSPSQYEILDRWAI